MSIKDPAARRRASILRIASLPVIAILLLVAVKLIAMVIVAQVTIVEYSDEDYETSAQAAQWNLAVNLVEPHKAHFNQGTAFLGSKLYEKAKGEFEEALKTAPTPDSCDVRINLSYALEGLGDDANAAERLDEAIEYYEQAAGVLADADKSCDDTTERQEELLAKAEAAKDEQQQEEQPPEPGEGDPEGEETEDGPFGDIEDKNQTGEQEKEDQETADRGSEEGGAGTEKPW